MPPAPRHRSFSPWLRVVIGWALLCPVLVVSASVPQARVPTQAAQDRVPKAAPKAPAQTASRSRRGAADGAHHHRSPHRRDWRSRGNSGAQLDARDRDGFDSLGRDDRHRSTCSPPSRTRSLLRITLGGIGSIEEGFDGTVGWSLSPMTGPTLVAGHGARAEAVRLRFPRRAARRRAIRIDDDGGEDGLRGAAVLQGAAGASRRRRGVRVLRRRDRAQGGWDHDAREPDGTDHGDQRSRATTRSSGRCCRPTTLKSTAMGLQQVDHADDDRVRHRSIPRRSSRRRQSRRW